MKEFTLLTVLNSITRHLLVTVVLFVVTYWSLSSLNIIDDQYMMKKTIQDGRYEPGHPVELLRFEAIHAIVSSANTAVLLRDDLGGGGVAQFQITKTKEKNIALVLKSHSPDNLINTAKLIMKRLKEFDERQIQNKISDLNSLLIDKHKVLQILLSSDDKYKLTNADIEQYVSMQRVYDTAYTEDVAQEYTSSINSLMRLKREEVNRKVNLERDIIVIEDDIKNLEYLIEEGFKGVSYIFPASSKDITKYYPNPIIFFGISLLVAFFYNLIMLNVVYFKYKKSV